MLKFFVNYQVCTWCTWHILFGNFLLLLQTGEMATHNTVNDVHLKQAEPWFRSQYISTCFLSETVFTEQGEKKIHQPHNEAVGPCGLMSEEQMLTSSVFKLQEQRMFSSWALFQFFEPTAMDSWSLTTLQFSHLATVKLLKRYLSTRFILYYCEVWHTTLVTGFKCHFHHFPG